MCLEIYKLDSEKFLLAAELAQKAALKNTKVKSELLTDIAVLLIVDKGIRGGLCHSNNRYAAASNKIYERL